MLSKNLILIGLPRSGKTTIGKELSLILERPFIDTDELLEKDYELHYGSVLTCREIYQKKGAIFFRDLEKDILSQLRTNSPSIIATGGGLPEKIENVAALKKLGSIIYLKADPETLWNRMESGKIPAYLQGEHPKKAFLKMVERRRPLYENAADLHYGIPKEAPQWLATRLAKFLKSRHGESLMDAPLEE